MADNVAVSEGSGKTIATDDVGGVQYQRIKPSWGPDGTANEVDTATGKPLPVQLRSPTGTDLTGTAGSASAAVISVQGVASGTVIPVSDNSSSLTVDNGGTFVVQENGGALTALQLLDDVVFAEDVAAQPADKGVHILSRRSDTAAATGGTDGDYQSLVSDSTGRLHVNVGNTVTVDSHAVTNAGTFATQIDGAALTALQLIDDTVTILGTDTYTEATSKGLAIGAVRRDADTTLVGTTNEFGPLQMDANGRLKVEVFSGETLPTSNIAGETHIGEVGGKTVMKTITMTATATVLASADIIADTQQMDAAFRVSDGTGVLQSLTVFDPDDNTAFAFDVYIHNTSTSLGSENSGITISDANAAAGIIGVVSFATTDAKDLINGRMYHKANIGLPVTAVSGTDDLYFSIVNGSGTPTFAGGNIPMRVGLLLD